MKRAGYLTSATLAALLTTAAVAALFVTAQPREGGRPPDDAGRDSPRTAPRSPAAPPAANQSMDDEAATGLLLGLIGSKHDFSQHGERPRDLCLPCHTPHIPTARAPLLDARPVTTQPLRPYQAIGIDLNSASLLCLSCHDGVIAPDVYRASHATASPQLGTSRQAGLLQGHPVGVPYPTADPKYHAAAAVTADGRIQLPDGRIQCTSCHDPHNRHDHDGMLVRSNDRSRLCLSCHRM